MRDGERETGELPLAVHEHGAGPALPEVAPLLAPVQVEMLAQRVEQRRARVEAQLAKLTVDPETHGHAALRGLRRSYARIHSARIHSGRALSIGDGHAAITPSPPSSSRGSRRATRP